MMGVWARGTASWESSGVRGVVAGARRIVQLPAQMGNPAGMAGLCCNVLPLLHPLPLYPLPPAPTPSGRLQRGGEKPLSLTCKLLEGLLDALRRQLPAPQPLAALHLPIPLAVHLQVPGRWAVRVGTMRRGWGEEQRHVQAQGAQGGGRSSAMYKHRVHRALRPALLAWATSREPARCVLNADTLVGTLLAIWRAARGAERVPSPATHTAGSQWSAGWSWHPCPCREALGCRLRF